MKREQSNQGAGSVLLFTSKENIHSRQALFCDSKELSEDNFSDLGHERQFLLLHSHASEASQELLATDSISSL